VPRLLLAYTGATWKDVQYTSPEQWFAGDKNNLKLDFPNLPYLIDGDLRITESEAISHYIINRSSKRELLGQNPQHHAILMNITGVLQEIFDNILKILYIPDGIKTKD
jgi:glutathione S-transferase